MLKRDQDLPDKTPTVMVDGDSQPIKGGVDLSVKKLALNSSCCPRDFKKKEVLKVMRWIGFGLMSYCFKIALALPSSLHLPIK